MDGENYKSITQNKHDIFITLFHTTKLTIIVVCGSSNNSNSSSSSNTTTNDIIINNDAADDAGDNNNNNNNTTTTTTNNNKINTMQSHIYTLSLVLAVCTHIYTNVQLHNHLLFKLKTLKMSHVAEK